jgi:hypothetical protein
MVSRFTRTKLQVNYSIHSQLCQALQALVTQMLSHLHRYKDISLITTYHSICGYCTSYHLFSLFIHFYVESWTNVIHSSVPITLTSAYPQIRFLFLHVLLIIFNIMYKHEKYPWGSFFLFLYTYVTLRKIPCGGGVEYLHSRNTAIALPCSEKYKVSVYKIRLYESSWNVCQSDSKYKYKGLTLQQLQLEPSQLCRTVT